MTATTALRKGLTAVEQPQGRAAPMHASLADVEFSDAEFGRIVLEGVLFGTPFIYVVTAAVMLLAAPGTWVLLAVAVWPAAFGGWFFGGMAAITVHELRRERPRAVPRAAPAHWWTRLGRHGPQPGGVAT